MKVGSPIKICVLLITLIFFTACDLNGNNMVSFVNDEENAEIIQNDPADMIYSFEYEANDDDFPNLNIWVDKYVDGEKKETTLSLSQNLIEAESDEGELTYIFKNIHPEYNDGDAVDLQLMIGNMGDTASGLLTDAPVDLEAQNSISYGPLLNDSSYTLSGEEEIIAGMIALNAGSRMTSLNLETDMPSNIDLDEYIKENAHDIDVLYIMKIQFSEEI